jgi:hypothetical protein
VPSVADAEFTVISVCDRTKYQALIEQIRLITEQLLKEPLIFPCVTRDPRDTQQDSTVAG